MTTDNIPNRCVMGRIMRHKKRLKKDFYVSDYGSWKAARRAAARWEADKAKELPARISIKGLMTKRNRSGVVGVRLAREVQRKPSGAEYVYWTWHAHWPGCPHTGGISWRTHVHGDAEAFVLALLSRQMESIDRGKILNAFLEIKNSPEFKTLARIKKQSAP